MTNIGLLHEISATFINICINLMRVYQKHAQMLCKIAFPTIYLEFIKTTTVKGLIFKVFNQLGFS